MGRVVNSRGKRPTEHELAALGSVAELICGCAIGTRPGMLRTLRSAIRAIEPQVTRYVTAIQSVIADHRDTLALAQRVASQLHTPPQRQLHIAGSVVDQILAPDGIGSAVELWVQDLIPLQRWISEQARRVLELASDPTAISGLFWMAAQLVYDHVLYDDRRDDRVIEEFAYSWLGFSRPARTEQRRALVEGVVDGLLACADLFDEVMPPEALKQTLRGQAARFKAVHLPVWSHQIQRQYVARLPMGGLPGASEDIAPGPVSDLPETRVLGPEVPVRLGLLLNALTNEERRIVDRYMENLPGISWDEAAVLAGMQPRMGESVRRKIRYRVRQLDDPDAR